MSTFMMFSYPSFTMSSDITTKKLKNVFMELEFEESFVCFVSRKWNGIHEALWGLKGYLSNFNKKKMLGIELKYLFQ